MICIPETKTKFLVIWIQSEKSLFQSEMQWLGFLYVFSPEIQSSSTLEQKKSPKFSFERVKYFINALFVRSLFSEQFTWPEATSAVRDSLTKLKHYPCASYK